jgi:hypothetical protein
MCEWLSKCADDSARRLMLGIGRPRNGKAKETIDN